MAGLSLVVFVTGAGMGYAIYARRPVTSDPLLSRFAAFYGILNNKFYFDAVYLNFFVRPYQRFTVWLFGFDGWAIDGLVNATSAWWVAVSALMWRADAKVIDGAVNGLATLVERAGARARTLEAGRVQVYQRLAYAGLLVALAVVLLLTFLPRGA
jgi:NADH-quinone oxidoreductase subunit L